MLKLLILIHPDPAKYAEYKATVRFVLQYPRRVYTNLFPAAQTWWLLFMVLVLNGIDWAAFELLNIGNAAVEAIPARFRVLDGLFVSSFFLCPFFCSFACPLLPDQALYPLFRFQS